MVNVSITRAFVLDSDGDSVDIRRARNFSSLRGKLAVLVCWDI